MDPTKQHADETHSLFKYSTVLNQLILKRTRMGKKTEKNAYINISHRF
jgi:hypothetical protein